jgi:hypothetical protein
MKSFRIFQILLISALTVMTMASTGDALAASDTSNNALMIADADTQLSKVEQTREVTVAEMNKGLWIAEIQGWKVTPGTIRRLGPPGTFHQPMINRAGTWVAFWGSETGKQGSDIWIAATDGSRWQQLTYDGNGNEGPQWSPDGQLIVYSSTMAFGGRRDSLPPIAVISATPLSGKAPLSITFDGTNSTDANGHLVSYSWDFGDGAKASGTAINHMYSSVGTYTVILTVTDDQDLKHSDRVIITVQ